MLYTKAMHIIGTKAEAILARHASFKSRRQGAGFFLFFVWANVDMNYLRAILLQFSNRCTKLVGTTLMLCMPFTLMFRCQKKKNGER